MKKGQLVEGTITEILFPNKGVMNIEGEEKNVIVKNTVKGQRVCAAVNKIRRGRAEGRVLEVLEKSPTEIEPSCIHFAECGGCTYQNLSYSEQITMKAGQVKHLLDEVCADYMFEGIKGSPEQFAYRNKMEFSFGDACKDGPLTLGMHKRGSFYDIVTVDHCRIVDSDFQEILTCVLEHFLEAKTDFYHKLSHQGYLRHLLVRKAKKTGEILVDLVTTSQRELLCPADKSSAGMCEKALSDTENELLEKMKEKLLALRLTGNIVGILHTVNDSLADVIQNDRTDVLYGQEYFYEELLGMRFKISPFSFFQTNSLGAEVLYDIARTYVGETKDKTIFDLYSGTGTIAQLLAPVAKKVIGIEIVEEAVVAARQNAALNGLANCEFLAGDVLKIIDSVTEKPDIIVLDPPRDGIHPKALAKIIDFGVDKIVYISCKPTSLARDLVILQESGYRLEKGCCVDLFPGTVHVETVALLTRKLIDRKDNSLPLEQ
ncbi:MAG: 23S rRNA (uracil(1939)-C(5))-methyltransferase RlmD [Eubacteriales bacterium]|nr:23S rRNA (uracil(1939)-C(5))-methyltransferase RlmD [Eubacteriales bacterium]